MKEQLFRLLMQTSTPLPQVLFVHYRQLQLSLEEMMWIVQYTICDGDLGCVAHNMEKTPQEIALIVNGLLEKQHVIMKSQTTLEGKIDIVYDLEPLFQKLTTLIAQSTQPTQQTTQDLITTFEKEFGRTLSSMELEMISGWVMDDKFETELIILALKEAVVSQALSLKYIDKILLNWTRKNIKTAQQVKIETQKYRQQAVTEGPVSIDERTAAILMMKHTK